MPDEEAVARLEAAARAVHKAAGQHKSAASQHKRKTRELMARYAELRDELERHGITLNIQSEDLRRSRP